jgi:hypothetical protein
MKRLSPATVIACVALAFALAGTGYAARSALLPANSVGSRQVINHSIKKIDLRAPLPRGPRGFAGQAGPIGPQGPAGSAGITQVTSVVGPAAAQCAAGGGACQVAQSNAVCPGGYTVVGGGYVSGAIENIVLYAARGSTTTYVVIAENEYTGANTIAAQAICAAGPGLVATSPVSKPPNIQSLREALTP